ncbi:F-box protein SNE-like [Impatiens glandulifera]|uniref:F-box protein SNE-like n=1 Tax=Impatiens glandulifera TaxID=253017 RepID=UPI001FB17237|nr:F-box protein SNE-like [Impatiens glandulifera]
MAMAMAMAKKKKKMSYNYKFSINNDIDLLTEILKRLDGRSLCVAACVCRLWTSISRNDLVWEHLCFRNASTAVRPVVAALGGYRRLYMVCIRPMLSRLARRRAVLRRAWTRQEMEMSLSLFCIDYYEKLGAGSGSGKLRDASASSLMFLCKPVNV